MKHIYIIFFLIFSFNIHALAPSSVCREKLIIRVTSHHNNDFEIMRGSGTDVEYDGHNYPLRNNRFERNANGSINPSLVVFYIHTPEGILEARLPAEMEQVFIEYLNTGHNIQPFDCMCFAHALNRIPYVFDDFSLKDWDYSRKHSASHIYKPGETFAFGWMSNNRFRPGHMAVHIGHGYFVHKPGTRNNYIIVTPLEPICMDYGNEVRLLTLKNNARLPGHVPPYHILSCATNGFISYSS